MNEVSHCVGIRFASGALPKAAAMRLKSRMVPSRDTAHNQVFRSRGILVDVRVELLYFGVIKDILGRERETLELCGGAKVEDAIRLLRGRASNDTSRIWESMAVAINREYAGLPDVLRDGDELALLPPVSGGCVWETT